MLPIAPSNSQLYYKHMRILHGRTASFSDAQTSLILVPVAGPSSFILLGVVCGFGCVAYRRRKRNQIVLA